MKTERPRILLVDDEQSIIDSYFKVLTYENQNSNSSRLADLDNKLFASLPTEPASELFELSSYNQGNDAIEAVKISQQQNRPFSAAFIDVRMPPGIDGISTAEQIRQLDPFINIVIVTAYSDISPIDIAARIQPPSRLLYMQKPFHSHEIRQFATALCAKWQAEKDLLVTNHNLDDLVKKKTTELTLTVEALEKSNQRYRETASNLRHAEAQLAKKAEDLIGSNQALQQMVERDKEERHEIEKEILFTIHEMVEPYLDRLQKSGLDEAQLSFMKILRSNLNEVTAPFMKDLGHKYFRLSPTEIKIAQMIKNGKTTKFIATELEMTKRTVDFHRDRIREKIGIKNTKANLKAILRELELEFLDNN